MVSVTDCWAVLVRPFVSRDAEIPARTVLTGIMPLVVFFFKKKKKETKQDASEMQLSRLLLNAGSINLFSS